MIETNAQAANEPDTQNELEALFEVAIADVKVAQAVEEEPGHMLVEAAVKRFAARARLEP